MAANCVSAVSSSMIGASASGGRSLRTWATFGLNLRQRRVGVVVQLEVDGDRAQRLRARRLDVVDAVGARDHALERRGDEAAHQVGVGADVERRHLDDGDVAARILAHVQRADRLQPGDQDDRLTTIARTGRLMNRSVNFISCPLGFGARLFAGCTLLFTLTAAPLRSLNTPDVTISAPASRPDTIAT